MDSDIEILAKIAARIAGYDPERSGHVQGGALFNFAGLAWRHPKFIGAAEAAYAILAAQPYPEFD